MDPIFVRTMSIASQKLRILCEIIFIEDKTVCFDDKFANFKLQYTHYLIFQHPIIGSQELNTIQVGCRGTLYTPLINNVAKSSAITTHCSLVVLVWSQSFYVRMLLGFLTCFVHQPSHKHPALTSYLQQ